MCVSLFVFKGIGLVVTWMVYTFLLCADLPRVWGATPVVPNLSQADHEPIAVVRLSGGGAWVVWMMHRSMECEQEGDVF